MIFLKAILLGIVEGLTEFLPISSSGHMILFNDLSQLSQNKSFSDLFLQILHFPAVLAVILYFGKQLWPFSKEKTETRAHILLWTRIAVAFLPAAVFGSLLNEIIEEHLYSPIPVALALLIGGIVLLYLEGKWAEQHPDETRIHAARDIGFKLAFLIGCFQCLAMIPGTSRSAATIIGAMLFGASRFAAAEFSFFLAIPTMLAASAYSLLKNGIAFTPEQWGMLGAGMVAAFFSSYAVIAVFMGYIQRHSFRPFGWYRIVLALAILGAYCFHFV